MESENIYTLIWRFPKFSIILFWASFLLLLFLQPISLELITFSFFGVIIVIRATTVVLYYLSLDSDALVPQELVIFTSIIGFIGIPLLIYSLISNSIPITVAAVQAFLIFYGAFMLENLLDYERNTDESIFGEIGIPLKSGENMTLNALVYLLRGYSYTFAENLSDLSIIEQALFALPINTSKTEKNCINRINSTGLNVVRIDSESTNVIVFDSKLNLKYFLIGSQKDFLPTRSKCSICESKEQSTIITKSETPYDFPVSTDRHALCEDCQEELLNEVLDKEIVSTEELAAFCL